MNNSDLPCARDGKCPHGNACCKHGVDLLGSESFQIMEIHGRGKVVEQSDGTFRTFANKKGCVFLGPTGCSIHHEQYYPEVCRKFPLDGYEGDDPDLCPEV